MTATAHDPSTGLSAAAPLPPHITAEIIGALTAQVRSTTGATVPVRAPFSGGVFVDLPQVSEDDVIAAFERARAAQQVWASRRPSERARILLRFHDLVLKRQDEVLDLIQLENGKARRDAFLEVADIANTSRYYARTARGLLRAKRRTGLLPGLTAARELHQPKGVVTIISPWNYPLALGAGDTIPALLAGNAVVQKPDNQTALTALWALSLAREAGLPTDVWQIVLGRGSAIGAPLIDNANYLMFTGSTAVGKRMAEQAGARLIGSSMELGGKNAMLVLDDADVDRTVEGAVRACFSSSGQLCISIERLYVQDGIYEKFVPRFVDAVRAMQIGAGYDFAAEMGSLTSAEQVEIVTKHVDDAVEHGATILAGGKARPDLGPYFFEPTVLTGTPPTATCFAEETFGPLVSIYRFEDVEEAISRANDTEYGLNASVWSRSAGRSRAVAARLHAGTVNINEAYAAAWGSVDAPMGGMGHSGLGRRHGADGLLKYTEPQTLARQRFMNIAPPGKMSYGSFAKLMSRSLALLRRIGWR